MKNDEANEKYYDRVSQTYDEKQTISLKDYSVFLRQLKRIIKPDKIKQGSTVLDCGCGTGRGALKFAKMGCRVTASDISSKMVQKTVENAKNLEFEVEGVTADCISLPFKDNSFDFVTLSAALHHIEEVDKALKEFYRVLKPGGALLLIAEHKKSIIRPEWTQKRKYALSSKYDREVLKIEPLPVDLHIFKISELSKTLSNIGFSKIRTKSFFILSSLYRDLFLYSIHNKKIKNGLVNIFNWIDEWLLFWVPSVFRAMFSLSAWKK